MGTRRVPALSDHSRKPRGLRCIEIIIMNVILSCAEIITTLLVARGGCDDLDGTVLPIGACRGPLQALRIQLFHIPRLSELLFSATRSGSASRAPAAGHSPLPPALPNPHLHQAFHCFSVLFDPCQMERHQVRGTSTMTIAVVLVRPRPLRSCRRSQGLEQKSSPERRIGSAS